MTATFHAIRSVLLYTLFFIFSKFVRTLNRSRLIRVRLWNTFFKRVKNQRTTTTSSLLSTKVKICNIRWTLPNPIPYIRSGYVNISVAVLELVYVGHGALSNRHQLHFRLMVSLLVFLAESSIWFVLSLFCGFDFAFEGKKDCVLRIVSCKSFGCTTIR